MAKLQLEFLEIMLLNPCNLSCKGCTTFSDLKWQGVNDWKQNKVWLESWAERLEIQAVGVMGGEPLMHPHLKDWLLGIRQALPNSQIRFVTNGLLLDKHQWIVPFLHEIGNCVFKISYHLQDDNLDAIIENIFEQYEWNPVTEFGINRWKTNNEFRFQIARPNKFYKTFQNDYADMKPHSNRAVDAFDLCVQKRCPLLLDGKLFKCGTAGLNAKVLQRHNWPNYELWKPYLNTGLDLDCSEEELQKFIRNFGKPHAMCKQCPTTKDVSSIIDHVSTVERK